MQVSEHKIMPDRLRRSVRKTLAQTGGGTPSYNPFAPGGVNFAKPGGQPQGTGVNRYYETPLDSNFKRKIDHSLKDETLSIEKRLQVFHDALEDDIKGYSLSPKEQTELDNSDKRLRLEKSLTDGNKIKPEIEEKVLEVCMEMLLDKARTNKTNQKHPYEDVTPEQIKPTRRHKVAIIVDRSKNTPFLGYENDEDVRSPYDIAKYTTPPDGSRRTYPIGDGKSTGKEINDFIQNPYDVDFGAPGEVGLYGETLAYDYPQDEESPAKTEDKKTGYIADKVNEQIQNGPQGTVEQQLALKQFLENQMRLPSGKGKPFRLNEFFNVNSNDEFEEPAGLADKYSPSSPYAAGLGYLGYSQASNDQRVVESQFIQPSNNQNVPIGDRVIPWSELDDAFNQRDYDRLHNDPRFRTPEYVPLDGTDEPGAYESEGGTSNLGPTDDKVKTKKVINNLNWYKESNPELTLEQKNKISSEIKKLKDSLITGNYLMGSPTDMQGPDDTPGPKQIIIDHSSPSMVGLEGFTWENRRGTFENGSESYKNLMPN